MSEPVAAGVAPAPAGLRRLHPLTPFIRGWKLFVAFAVVVTQQFGLEHRGSAVWALVALGAALPVAAVFGWLAWLTTTFGFTGEDLRIDSGILVRRSRRVRLDRLQAVDVVRPLLARLSGLAELRLEVVGSRRSEGGLAYLGEDEARRLRAEILARAAGLGAAEDAAEPPREEAPEHPLHEVPWGRYLASLVLSVPTLVCLGIIGVAIGFSVGLHTFAPLAVVLPALALPVQQAFGRGQAEAGFQVSGAADGLRIRHGLLESRQQTVPPGRVQALRIVSPLLWRPWGWVRLEIAVAGYGRRGQSLTGTLLPVAPRAEAIDLLHRVLAAEVGDGPGARLDLPLAPAPRRARWVDPLGWRVLGVGLDDDVLVTRRGVFRRITDVVPHVKIQSVRLVQGPLQRRLGLASVHLDLPPHIQPEIRHRDLAEASALVADEVIRTHSARARARAERWAG